jgi:hypothetical protein
VPGPTNKAVPREPSQLGTANTELTGKALSDEIMLWQMARAWVDEHSGRHTWRVLDVSETGFRYDGEGFFAPQLQHWGFLEVWGGEVRV